MYRKLDPERLLATILRLEARIAERFPGAGLAKVCVELAELARSAGVRSRSIGEPILALRALVAFVVAAAALIVWWLWQRALSLKAGDELFSALEGIDAAINIVLVSGGALFFIATLEIRLKRRRALRDLHEVRSLVHVVDMHQLTKDPTAHGGPRTSSSPERPMTLFEQTRYLNYCSEMISLAAKVAALYAERLIDAVVVEAVSDIERLAAAQSQKIWQKIAILEEIEARAGAGQPPTAPPPSPVAAPVAPTAAGPAAAPAAKS
jgi:hypothetical protein